MSTQSGCFTALHVLVSRIQGHARDCGIKPVRKLAAATGVSKSGIDKIYQHQSYPTFDTLLSIAKACGTTVEMLVRDLEQDKQAEPSLQKQAEQRLAESRRKKAEAEQAEKLARIEESIESGEPMKPEPPTPPPQQTTAKVDVLAMLKGMKPL